MRPRRSLWGLCRAPDAHDAARRSLAAVLGAGSTAYVVDLLGGVSVAAVNALPGPELEATLDELEAVAREQGLSVAQAGARLRRAMARFVRDSGTARTS